MSVGSDELLIWIDANRQLEADKRAIFDKLARWRVSKTYTADKARKAFSGLIRRAADHYVSQGHGRSRKASEAFPKGCRGLAAKDLERAFAELFKAGRWEALQRAQMAKDKRARERKAKAKRHRW